MPIPPPTRPIEPDLFDDDEDGWQDMPVIQSDDFSGLDEEDQKRYHYVAPTKKSDISSGTAHAGNATGNLLDVDDLGIEWRTKSDQNESEYTRLRLNEEEDADEVHLRTRYLFDEDKAMTPLSQMQATKNLLTEAQRIAYVGVCALTSREMTEKLRSISTENGKNKDKDLKAAIHSMELWALKIMGRLYYHMELETAEQKMIESLGVHGVRPEDLVPSLMTTHTIANPEYDPVQARKQAEEAKLHPPEPPANDVKLDDVCDDGKSEITLVEPPRSTPTTPTPDNMKFPSPSATFQTTHRVLEETSTAPLPGVSTSLSPSDANVTLDIRWTVLCDLFLLLVADSVYDARSRVLLEQVALKLGLGWLDVVKFEKRVTEALEIQEGVEKMEQREIVEGREKMTKKKRYMMVGLATLGGGLVIGLSAGLLAPVIGAGLGAAFTTIGVTGTTGFLAGTGGAAAITAGGVLTGSGIAAKGMARRTKHVRTFDLLPLHNNKRVNCLVTVPGFMTGAQDDVRLPFSVLDPIIGDVFSVLWEPEMIQETGDALKILTTEVLTQIGQTVLSATVMTALMSALQWPIVLTKLGYLIDNPWSNACDRAKSAGGVLADVLIQRHLGVRPISLIGFSLGARVIFYCLIELHRQKQFGIVQDVFLLGATVTAPTRTWIEARSVVSGRFVNGFARNDWVLNYLFRAAGGGLNAVAGLRPLDGVPGLENVDVTDKISGHMSYRTFMPLILDQLGFPVSADYFDEPQQPEFNEDRIVVREGDEVPKKKGWFGRTKSQPQHIPKASRPPSAANFGIAKSSRLSTSPRSSAEEDLPPREETKDTSVANSALPLPPPPTLGSAPYSADSEASSSTVALPPKKAGFDFGAIKDVIEDTGSDSREIDPSPRKNSFHVPPHSPTHRSESTPPLAVEVPMPSTPVQKPSLQLPKSADRVRSLGRSSLGSELPSSFSRSMSLYQAQNREDEEASTMSFARTSPTPSRFGSQIPALSTTSISRSPPARALSFGSNDGSVWAPPEETTTNGPYGFRDFGSTLSFGRNDGSITSSGSAYQSPFTIPQNPFASSTSSLAGGASLSFGGADGTITLDSSPVSATTPSATTDWRKAAFNANPWG
ncbi:hypothetical protein JAAARDRAFT_119620 [Jaapia argillacea MUCL 33604]|uniref:DUF726-domain-containing protein n=1 Tax=Jaapia argillacea MUCL 33604 TaxID=933084 RepID=A0A067Q7F6_9AGAM|nr:hypothetical protein JAAARDRAFT_119620 [Jaapia argillacea MUCL 33604]